MGCPIRDITVSPSYGKSTALIRWAADPTVAAGNFIIQRSVDGITGPWEKLGSDYGLTEFQDTDFIVPNKHQQMHYKIIVQANGVRYDSDAVGVFDKLSRKEYGMLYKMISKENHRMDDERNGIPVVLLRQRVDGKPCPVCVDPDTGQQVGTTVCETCYGTGIEGGYYDPVRTYTEIMEVKKEYNYDPSGKDATDATPVVFYILAYPEMRKGDLIVKPETDDRFIIEAIKPFMFRGIVPFTYQLSANLLDRNHIRYNVPIE